MNEIQREYQWLVPEEFNGIPREFMAAHGQRFRLDKCAPSELNWAALLLLGLQGHGLRGRFGPERRRRYIAAGQNDVLGRGQQGSRR